MAKKSRKKSSSKKVSVSKIKVKKTLSMLNLTLWVLGILIVLAIIVATYNSITGNVITGLAGNPLVQLSDGVKSTFTDILAPFVNYVIGGDTTDQTLVFAKFLFLIIVLVASFAALDNIQLFDDKKWVVWVLSLAVSLLGVRWIGSDNIIQAVILPSSTFAIAISAGLPFFLYFLIVEKSMAGAARQVRNMAWIFFIVIFTALWWYRYDQLGGSSAFWIYPATVFLGFLCLLFDGTIQGWFMTSKIQRANAGYKGSAIRAIQAEMTTITHNFTANSAGYIGSIAGGGLGQSGPVAYHKDMAELEKQLKLALK